MNVTVTFSLTLALTFIGSDDLLQICFWLSDRSEASFYVVYNFFVKFLAIAFFSTGFATGLWSFINFFGFIVHNASKSMQDADSSVCKFFFSNRLLSNLYICASILVGMDMGRIAINKWKRKILGYCLFLKLLLFSSSCNE